MSDQFLHMVNLALVFVDQVSYSVSLFADLDLVNLQQLLLVFDQSDCQCDLLFAGGRSQQLFKGSDLLALDYLSLGDDLDTMSLVNADLWQATAGHNRDPSLRNLSNLEGLALLVSSSSLADRNRCLDLGQSLDQVNLLTTSRL